MIKSAVITGATGGIGSALAKCFLDKGVKVYAIVRKGTLRIDNLPKSDLLNVIYCDLCDYDSLLNAGVRADAFFHFAWDKTTGSGRDDYYLQLDNVKYCLNAVNLAAAFDFKKFIGAGSQAEYGVKNEPL